MVGDEREVLAPEALLRQLQVARGPGQRLRRVEAVVDAPPRAVQRRRARQVALAQRPVQPARVAAAALDVDLHRRAGSSPSRRGSASARRRPRSRPARARRAARRSRGRRAPRAGPGPRRPPSRRARPAPGSARRAPRWPPRRPASACRAGGRARRGALREVVRALRRPRERVRDGLAARGARRRRDHRHVLVVRRPVAAAARSPRRRRSTATTSAMRRRSTRSRVAGRAVGVRPRLARRAPASRPPRDRRARGRRRIICGLHAQVMSSAQLTLWARMEDPPDVEDLLWSERDAGQDLGQRGHAAPAAHGRVAAVRRRPGRAQAALRAEVVAEALRADARRTCRRSSPASRRRSRTARSRARSSRDAGPRAALGRGYGDLLKPVAFRGELIFGVRGPNCASRCRSRSSRWSRGGHARARAPLPHALRPGDARGLREVVRQPVAAAGRALDQGARRRGGRDRVRLAAGRATSPAIEAAAPSGVVRLLPAFDQYVVAAPRDDAGDVRAGAHLPPGRLVLARPARRRRDGRRLEPGGRRGHDRAVRAGRRGGARGGRGRGRAAAGRTDVTGGANLRATPPLVTISASYGAGGSQVGPALAAAPRGRVPRPRDPDARRRPPAGAARRRARPRRVARRRDRALASSFALLPELAGAMVQAGCPGGRGLPARDRAADPRARRAAAP